MADIPIPPIPPRRAPLIDIMRELEARPRARQSQEFDPVAALAAERRSQSRQPLPLPPIPPAVAPPRTAGDSAEAGPPLDLSAVAPTIRSRLPENNPYVSAAIDIAEKYNLPRDVFLSLVHQESKFDPKAKSPRGAFGLTQLMPGTARELGVDPRDPMANLDAGARYLRQQIDRFGSLPLALAAYNAGPQRVIDAGRVVPNIRETQDYVHKIMRNAGMEGYGYAEGGLAELDEKYAEGGRIRRPAVAPVASPFDADYIERLAARAVGAGEPVTEVRSSEGRGFAPMPRDATEALQRMAAVVRGDVEPTPEEERQISHVRGFTEGPASIRAYHGSPYAFERFDINKVGTGEGAQAYGRGLYFAESEPVARYYRDTLSKDFVSVDGRRIPEPTAENIDAQNIYRLANHMYQMGINSDQAIESAINRAQKLSSNLSSDDFYKRKEAERARDWVNSIFPLRGKSIEWMKDPGAMYEVNLNANPREFLNWDLPLSQQSRDVQESLSRFGLRADSAAMRAYDNALLDALHNDPSRPLPRMPRDPTGEEIYQRALRMTPEEARVALMQAGIPGTRYLDAGSRGVGGSYNYAVFDPEIIDITRRYAEGGLAELDEKYAQGGTVRAPKETTIAGQEHKLAYITDREAALLKARGGSGRMTEHGVRAYDEGPGGEGPGGDPSDNAGSMSEAATQDAAGGNQGQGAGPTGAGAGSGPPGGPDSNPNEDAGTETSVTAPTTAPTTGAFGQFGAATGLGVVGGLASFGIGAPGLGTAAAGFGAALDAAKANEQLGMMGLNQTVDRDSAIANAVSMGAFGQSVANQFGQALGFDALAEAPMSAFSTPNPLGDIAASQMDSGGSQYVQTEYETPGLSNIATSMAPTAAASLVDWSQIQREASAMNMSVSDYLAMKWRSPATMARGGMASLEQMHAKYAEGGDVRAPAGEVAEYNPEEIDRIARQIHLRFPEDDMPRTTYDEVESPTDLITRARLLMRGQNVGQQTVVGTGRESDSAKASTSLMNLPFEDDRYNLGQRVLGNNLEIVLDPETKSRLGIGLQAIEMSGPQGGAIGYMPQISAGYGPLSLQAGYRRMTPNNLGAKSQDSYIYGGNLEIPLDEQGAAARLGANIMAGRRGTMGMGSAGTQITGSLERPLLGGRLALELAADPSLRHKEILLGYRRAF